MRSVNVDSTIKKTRELRRQSAQLIQQSEQLLARACELPVTNLANRNNRRDSQKRKKSK